MLATVLLASGCGGGAAQVSTPVPVVRTHLVSGTLAQVGGPAGNPPRYPDGTITLTSGTGAVSTAAAHHGRFSVRVAAGRYTVTGRTPSFGDGTYECRAGQPLVVDSDVSGVQVLCQMR